MEELRDKTLEFPETKFHTQVRVRERDGGHKDIYGADELGLGSKISSQKGGKTCFTTQAKIIEPQRERERVHYEREVAKRRGKGNKGGKEVW